MLEKKLPKSLFYHGPHHAIDVYNSVVQFDEMGRIEGEKALLLQTAALFHDTGFIEQYEKNEPNGARIASNVLRSFGYTLQQRKEVKRLILATKIPQEPKSAIEQIICDADLRYLGSTSFFSISNSLRRELEAHGKTYTEPEWYLLNYGFMEKHRYFSRPAKKLLEDTKKANMLQVEAKLAELGVLTPFA